MNRIAVVTGSRADYCPLYSVIEALGEAGWIVPIDGMMGHEAYLKRRLEELKPDAVVLLGDRYETLVAASVAALLCIPIAHIGGGDVTEGANDESFRHAITKLAYWHFTACDLHSRRVIQMGEAPMRVFTVGTPGVDQLVLPVLSRQELETEMGVPLKSPISLVCYHPETWGTTSIKEQMFSLYKEMLPYSDGTALVSGANADIGGDVINKHWEEAEGIVYRKSFGQRLWLSALHHTDVLIGNSSGFIFEGMTLKKKVIIVGERQQGRYRDALDLFAKEEYPFGKPGEVGSRIAQAMISLRPPVNPRKVFVEQTCLS